ncbi:MAG: prolyl oligopeptidase family serine peptidase [Acidobacteriota bacterium]
MSLAVKALTQLAVMIAFCLSINGQYAGRYTDGKDYAVYFEQTKYGLTIRPVMWTATQLLRETSKDRFEVVDRTSRGADFTRDKTGNVVQVIIRGMDGEGLQLRKADAPQLPVELFLIGRSREAAAAYIAQDETSKALDVAEQVLNRLPTKTATVVSFLRNLSPNFATDAKFHSLLGYALVQIGDRTSAIRSLRRAYALDPKNEETISALARLNAPPNVSTESGWKLSFPLASVFAKPTAAEIKSVERDWAARDLAPRGVKEELKSTIVIADRKFNVRIVSHLVHGNRHYGAIIIPENAAGKSLPVIIEAKGVSPTYFPLELERVAAPRMMGDSAENFIYVVPSFRGEVLKFDGETYTSEGDRTDALDGATDDAIALLNVALERTPEIDPHRICAFGHSRGGNVALLEGIRDKRIDCVVNWSGPTDWFYAMGTNGWTEQELWSEALRTRANTLQTGGQNVERFLKRAIDGEAGLKDVRHRMIASSPLYFAHRLPQSQHHYGLEDPSVPVRNGRELVARLRRQKVSAPRFQAFFYPGQGHDTDRILAPITSREFILRVLSAK